MKHDKLLWTCAKQKESEELWHSKIREIRATLKAIEKGLQ